MAYIIYSDKKYPTDNKPVNDVIKELQSRYKFLNKLDQYITQHIDEYGDYAEDYKKPKFNNYLTKLFRRYITLQVHGVKTKDQGISFIDTGLLVTSAKVKYEVEYSDLVSDDF